MDTRGAYLSVRKAEQELNLPSQLSLESLRDHLEEKRKREIVIEELADLPGNDVCGVWLGTEEKDLILHTPTPWQWHRQQIILHEFGHMILSHDLDATPADLKMASILDIDPTTVRYIFLRGSYSDEAERAAEMVADRLSARMLNSEPPLASEHLAFGEVFG
ncbi:hypothetical protein [Arthrobacter sp. SDTb3-6]|uniref:hypothetical protein n=1 Tax=Arthrobacter sp. SDTb3-6 TaxID=2713571 RepID=UPI00159DB5BC|nr:hypothetical protein [Arthrobacter sp. SDTb3-6]NVM97756.1 hypothetical protein [Arthrobacter sp. SDTb3-6]